MLEELHALDENDTWDLVDLPKGKKVDRCKWVFAIKINLDSSVARLKANLMAKGYAQTYRVDYSDTSSLAAKLTSIRLLYHWLLYGIGLYISWISIMISMKRYI